MPYWREGRRMIGLHDRDRTGALASERPGQSIAALPLNDAGALDSIADWQLRQRPSLSRILIGRSPPKAVAGVAAGPGLPFAFPIKH